MTIEAFPEEKQVKDLEQALSELQNIKLGNEGDNETLKLKRLFLTFKTKYQQALKELAQREKSQSHSELAKKYEELEDENRALVQQQQILKEMVRKGKEQQPQLVLPEVRKLEEQNQKLQLALQDKDRQIEDLKHYELGFKRLSDENSRLERLLNTRGDGDRQALKEENDLLRRQLEGLQKENWQMVQRIEQQKDQSETLSDQEARLKQELSEQKAANSQLRGELGQMKESMVRGLREARELKQYYQNLINEKTAVLEKNTQIQRQIQELREDVKRKQLALDSAQSQIAAVKEEKCEFERLVDQKIREIQEKDENVESLAKQIQTVRLQLQKYEEKARQKEDEAIEAQQHLAKKVREASLLSEKIEDKHRFAERLQEEILDYKAKLAELQTALDKEREKAEHIHHQIDAVEKKYFRTHEKLQKSEAEVRELRKVEERHQQMQQLLSNLGNVIGNPVGLAQQQGLVKEEVPPPVKKGDPFPSKNKPAPKPSEKPIQDDLFDRPLSSANYKKDFFE